MVDMRQAESGSGRLRRSTQHDCENRRSRNNSTTVHRHSCTIPTVTVGLAMLAVGAILAASVALALGAARTTLPALVAFLGLGMLLGSDGPGGIAFDAAAVAREVGIVSLAAILYDGGLSTSWRRLRTVAVPATLLSTVGVAVSAGLTGCFAHLLFDLSWAEAFLLG